MDNIFNVFLPLTFPYLHRVFILKGFGLCFPAIMISLLCLLSVSLSLYLSPSPPLYLSPPPLFLPFLLPSLPSLSLSPTPSVCLSTLTRLSMHSHFPLSLSLYLSHSLKRRCAPLISFSVLILRSFGVRSLPPFLVVLIEQDAA